MPHKNQIDFQKEKELKQLFNQALWDIKQAKCTPNEVLENKIFLFQTNELVKDSLSLLITVHDKHKSIPFTGNELISSIYGGIYQRDVSMKEDSTHVSNWYIKRFSLNEIREIDKQRKTLAFRADSLNLEIIKLEKDYRDSQTTRNPINPLRNQRNPIAASRDSIDFILYPSLLLEMKSWYEYQFDQVIPSPFNPETYLGPRGYNQKGIIIDSDTDPFLNQTFRLHHVFDNNPYYAKSIYLGDSTTLNGHAIFSAKYIREDYSPWGEGRFSYWSLNGKYLVVLKQESNIGETFWDYRSTYYVYELVK